MPVIRDAARRCARALRALIPRAVGCSSREQSGALNTLRVSCCATSSGVAERTELSRRVGVPDSRRPNGPAFA